MGKIKVEVPRKCSFVIWHSCITRRWLIPHGRFTAEAWSRDYSAIWIVASVYWTTTSVAFWYMRNNPYFLGRSILWTLVQAAVAFLIVSTVCATHLFWYMPCFIQMFGFQTFGMFWAVCVLFKGVKFYYEFKVNQAKLFGADVASSSGSTGQLDVGSVAEAQSGSFVSPISTSRSSTAIADATSYLQESYHWRHRHRATDRYLGNVALALVALDIIVLIVNQVSSPRFRLIPEVVRTPGCYSEWEYYPLWAIMCLYLLVCCPFMIYKIRSAKDNHGVQRELMLIVFAGLPLWILFLMWDFLDETLYTKFPSANWWIILMFVTHTFSIVVPVYHAVKADHLRKALTLKQNTTSFLQVLAERTVWEDFKKFMAADFCIENALFFEAHEELMAMVTTAYLKLYTTSREFVAPSKLRCYFICYHECCGSRLVPSCSWCERVVSVLGNQRPGRPLCVITGATSYAAAL
ncbi:hypothetical protein BC832DRAFT_302497 [Gaertneriomyces semiglobifer]|nr:hypothetical protein BC832DRAFT_302497 [Gaertneriomyces semiglobifer]